RLGYLPPKYSQNASRAWQGILAHFVQTGPDGSITITGTVKGIGLSDTLSRDGSYSFYVHSPVVSNDPKGVGAFLLAATEMEIAPQTTLAHKTVMVDAWFNSQQRLNAAGQEEYFHYKWTDYSNSGISLLGHIFKSHGAKLAMLTQPPTLARLRNAQVYFIVSPDIPKWNPHPHYVQPNDAQQIAEWVEKGGTLILMENDPANADFAHFNRIADQFGIHFDSVLNHHVIDPLFGPGFIPVSGAGPIFHHPHTIYMKDTCGISVKAPATALLKDKDGIVIAAAKYGKGSVVAVIDPWLYNEYTDHRKTKPAQQNFAAGEEFATWLLDQTPNNHSTTQRSK
ncbi:MAG: glycoside hydrolase family 88 protein, partial [Acidobacteriaceae bacterium]